VGFIVIKTLAHLSVTVDAMALPGCGNAPISARFHPRIQLRRVQVPQRAILNHGPCNCPQGHCSILYVYKQPIGLLGGLSFVL
jgi:hypothetical protein